LINWISLTAEGHSVGCRFAALAVKISNQSIEKLSQKSMKENVMSNVIAIPISEPVARFASQLAMQTQQPYAQVLSELLDSIVPVELLSDEEVMALADSKLSDEQDDRLSELLALQRESQLDEAGRLELAELMRVYEQGLLRKAQALRVAVERGLREPLQFGA
jgi:hypothetical protein